MKDSKYIDHTLLKAVATKEDIVKLCNEAVEHDFMSVCVNPYWVNFAKDLLKGTDVKVCTVVGFPLGANASDVKAYETTRAIADGADEIDMVINIGEAVNNNFDVVYNDILAVVKAANGVLVKVIIETCYLTDLQKEEVSKLCVKAKADFVKTSTGFGTGGATLADVKLMRASVGPDYDIKASGGVKTQDDFTKMKEAGATRIGTSNGVSLVGGKNDDSNAAY